MPVRNKLRLTTLVLLLALAAPAAQAQISVKDFQKITDGEGGLEAAFEEDANFGFATANLGDVDGDGVPDLAVGAPYFFEPSLRSVYVLFLNQDGTVKGFHRISSEEAGIDVGSPRNDFGQAVAGLGDVDGDGVPDLAAGARRGDGVVYVLFLNRDGTVKDRQKILAEDVEGSDSFFGWSVAGLGDVDGDGVPDLAVGDPREGVGNVYVLLLNQDGTVKALQRIGRNQGGFTGDIGLLDEFGKSVAGLGDVDGDGVPDLAAGTLDVSGDNQGAEETGAVFVLLLNRDGTVKGQQEISATAGGLTVRLNSYDAFGDAVAGLGDVDSDGIPDLAAGALGDDDGGAVYVLLLNRDGTVRRLQKISEHEGGVDGDLGDGFFGRAVAGLGDLNGDGVVDLAAGAGDNVGEDERGAVFVLFLEITGDVTGTPPPLAPSPEPRLTLESPNPDAGGDFGQNAATVPDVDGDGVAEILVGTPDEEAERTYLFSGATGERLLTLNPPEGVGRFGGSVAGASDVDGDGRGDLLVGAPGRERAYLFNGATGALLHVLEPPGPAASFGLASAAVPDTDGDGIADLLIGAPRQSVRGMSNIGRAYLYSGATGELLQELEVFFNNGNKFFGQAVAGVPDLDGDGRGDLLIGAPNRARVYLFSGATGELVRTLEGPRRFGLSVSGVPDVDGDGRGDLLIGAQEVGGESLFGNLRTIGRAFLYSGATGELLLELGSPKPDSDSNFGQAVAGVPDVDGDGGGDLLIGATYDFVGGEDVTGRAYLFSGKTGELLFQVVSPNPQQNNRFGQTVAAAPGSDGRTDLLVGAPGERYEGAISAGRVYLFTIGEQIIEPPPSPPSPPAEDTTPPECEIVSIEPGPPTTLRVRLRDGGSGLAEVRVKQSTNATVNVPAFSAGIQTVVFVTAEKVDQRKRSTVVLEVEDMAGNTTTCDPVVTTVSAEVPEAFELGANYPNPFNPTTKITFQLAEHSDVHLAVYDVVGREVAVLASEPMEAGAYEVEWDGRDASGRVLPSGLYLYRLTAGSLTQARTMTLLK